MWHKIRKVACLILLLSALGALGLDAFGIPLGVWVTSHEIVTPAKIDAVIQTAVETGIDVLYVQIVAGGEAYYNSKILPKSEYLLQQLAAAGIDADFDPFGYLLNRAAEHGLRVVPWMNCFDVGSWRTKKPRDPRHVINAHPNWVTYHMSGVSLLEYTGTDYPGIWLDPGLKEVRDFLASIAEEIITTYRDRSVDEIHLDFIRYPGRTFGYHPRTLKEYRSWMAKMRRERKLHDFPYPFDEYRMLMVEETVQTISKRIKSLDPAARVSAAVISSYTNAVKYYFQAWDRWVNDGVIDYVVLMAYASEPCVIDDEVRTALQLTNGQGIKVGLGAYMFSGKVGLFAKAIDTVLAHKGVQELDFFSIESIMKDPKLKETIVNVLETVKEQSTKGGKK